MENLNSQDGKAKTLRDFLNSRTFIKSFLSIVLGGLAGYLYYYFIGCKSGTCAITSNPVNSIIAGSLMGFVLTFGNSKEKNKANGGDKL